MGGTSGRVSGAQLRGRRSLRSSGRAAKRLGTANSRVERRVERVEIDDFSSCIVPTTPLSPRESGEGGLTEAPGSTCAVSPMASGAQLSASPRVSGTTRLLPGSGDFHVLCFNPGAQGRLSAGWWRLSSAFANDNCGPAAASARRVRRVRRGLFVRRDFESSVFGENRQEEVSGAVQCGGSSLQRDISVCRRWRAVRMG